MSQKNAYQHLCAHYQHIHKLSHLSAICSWDRATNMPSGGNAARAEALAELSVLIHQRSNHPQLGDWFDQADTLPLSSVEQASLTEMRRHWRNQTALPEDLVKAKSLASADCEHAWQEQRPNNDWKSFKPKLKQVIALSREEAQIRSTKTGLSAYDAMLDLYEPGVTMQQLDSIFSQLKTWLPDLIKQVVAKQSVLPKSVINGPYPQAEQHQLGLAIMKKLGFDFNHGRLDISAHPFCGGVSSDVRITTRYEEEDFTRALMGVVHETGHARYEQNLPHNLAGLPVGEARSMGIHESQSLFFEMQLGRSKAFIKHLLPLVNQHLHQTFSLEQLQQHYLRVKPGLIRVDADEVTYPAHILLRYEMERDLIGGKLQVDDIPERWDTDMQHYLGLSTKGDYNNGCMQDVHWPAGLIGYFPSYSLGAMYAAQFHATIVKQHPEVLNEVDAGNYQSLFAWLQQHIWSQASLYSSDTLVKNATGDTLNLSYFKQHLEQRYL